MSCRIAVDIYKALIALRPDWASAKDDDAETEKGKTCVVKAVITGSAAADTAWQPHINFFAAQLSRLRSGKEDHHLQPRPHEHAPARGGENFEF